MRSLESNGVLIAPKQSHPPFPKVSSVDLYYNQPSIKSLQPTTTQHRLLPTMSPEPPTKKQKNAEEWRAHKLNINGAVDKTDEASNLSEIAEAKVEVLQGIGPKKDHVLEALHIETVKELGEYKFFVVARAIQTLAETEEKGGRPKGSVMNLDHILDKDHETKSLNELLHCPVSALAGVTETANSLLKSVGVKTVKDLAQCKYFLRAEAITALAFYEELKTKEERRLAKELHKLE